MRHKIDGNRLGRDPEHRIAMMRNLVRSLVRHERIETTLARAKELRRDAEKIITLGKKGTLHARRQAFADLRD
ncbi:MAG: 50S ribosomal protein L17, partial [Candidatus Methylomirabilis sp.]|nr:50S ribosomal protein L17 [Deltaproteobacteria bacterium]